MSDLDYETGLRQLLERLDPGHPSYTEAQALQSALWENLNWERLYGSSETGRAERAQIVDALNTLSLETLGISFNDLILDSVGAYKVERTISDQYNLKLIRKLVRDAFMIRDLRRFFQDSPVFRPVITYLAPDSSLEGMIDVLIEYCRTRMLFPQLLAEIRALNPRQYERYHDRILRSSPTVEQVGVRSPIGTIDSIDLRIEHYQKALQDARRTGDRQKEGAALGNLGLAYADSGDMHRALQYYQRQMAVMENLEDRRGQAVTLSNLGNVYADLGDSHRAIKCYEQVRKLSNEIGDRQAEGNALGNLGLAYGTQGQFAYAAKLHKQALAIARELGDQRAEAIRLQNLGLALLRLADVEPNQRQNHLSQAAKSFHQAMALFTNLRMSLLRRARVRYHLGRCYHKMGHWNEAFLLLEQALDTFSRHRARPEWARTLLELGRLYHQYQDFESAYLYLKDALRLFRRLEDADGVAVAQEAVGNLMLQTAQPAEAIDFLEKAREGYETLKRAERLHAVDDLLRIARQAYQPLVERRITT